MFSSVLPEELEIIIYKKYFSLYVIPNIYIVRPKLVNFSKNLIDLINKDTLTLDLTYSDILDDIPNYDKYSSDDFCANCFYHGFICLNCQDYIYHNFENNRLLIGQIFNRQNLHYCYVLRHELKGY